MVSTRSCTSVPTSPRDSSTGRMSSSRCADQCRQVVDQPHDRLDLGRVQRVGQAAYGRRQGGERRFVVPEQWLDPPDQSLGSAHRVAGARHGGADRGDGLVGLGAGLGDALDGLVGLGAGLGDALDGLVGLGAGLGDALDGLVGLGRVSATPSMAWSALARVSATPSMARSAFARVSATPTGDGLVRPVDDALDAVHHAFDPVDHRGDAVEQLLHPAHRRRDPGDQRERLRDAVPDVSHRGEDVEGTGHRRQSHRGDATQGSGAAPSGCVSRVGPLPRVGGISGPSPVSWETSALCERPGAGTRARPTTRRCRHRWGMSRRGTARVAAASPGAAAAGCRRAHRR